MRSLPLLLLAGTAQGEGGLRERLEEALRGLVANKSAEWNNSAVSVGYWDGEVGASVAAGWTDRQSKGQVTTDNIFGYGSGTKMFTAKAVLYYAEQGMLDLDAPVEHKVDSVLSQEPNGTTLQALFGANASRITARQLLQMRSGIADWDTEGARDWQAAHPTEVMTPLFLMRRVASGLGSPSGSPWVCPPGECGWYSSTSYVVLGYLIAYFQKARTWSEVRQGDFPGVLFPNNGTWADLPHSIHGYQPDGSDVYHASPVNGWTSGNAAMTPATAAKFAYDLYGPASPFLSAASVSSMENLEQLLPFAPGLDGFFYGMGTSYLGPTDRMCWDSARGWYYGHPGAANGFYSWTGYNPRWNFALSVATNEEYDPFQKNMLDIDDAVYNVVVSVVNATRGPSAADPPLPTLLPPGTTLKPCW
eukprot:TRINITY_DN46975_c0_g1_i1.p1 TRINITY_DN46975_c0_g1~~TRINITY_DN46975_c0_g1_i1.p1  ORF type:complete len:418 (+),score=125.01 TRINITY_DN46975_c0_g1_i1:54-1307(+)